MNKLLTASVLVLGLAATQAFAGDSGTAAQADGGLAVAAQVNSNNNSPETTTNTSTDTKTITKTSTETNTSTSTDSHNYTRSGGTDVKVGDVQLELNAAVSHATLANTTTNNTSDDASGISFFNRVEKSASLGSGALSGWQGLAQVSVAAGANNVAEMNQQVSANVRNLTVN
jgi:hypothetical protein